jgi:ATP-dependent RNA helicase DeaD
VEYYVHRIGRTARAGRAGRAVTFAGPEDIYRLRAIQKFAPVKAASLAASLPVPATRQEEATPPPGLADRIKQAIDAGGLEREKAIVERIMADDYTSPEIASALIRLIQDRVPAGVPEHRDQEVPSARGAVRQHRRRTM